MRPLLVALFLVPALLGLQTTAALPAHEGNLKGEVLVRGACQVLSSTDGSGETGCMCRGTVCGCDLSDPTSCTLSLPIQLGTSCTISGPAGAACAYTCASGETQHVRAHPKWGGFTATAGHADCGGAAASCWNYDACDAEGGAPPGIGSTYQGTCTVDVDNTLASCSSGAAAVPPDPPQSPSFEWTSATGGVLSWSPPDFTGGGAVTHYTVYAGQAPVGASTTTSYTLAGMDPDTAPAYHVTASSAQGEGAAVEDVIAGNTACHSSSYSQGCGFQCVPGSIVHVYGYDAVGQLQGNVLSATATCGTATATCTGVNSCTGSQPNLASTSSWGSCSGNANTYVACSAGNVEVVPGPPTGTQAQLVRNCPQSWGDLGTCVTITWGPPAFVGGAPPDGYIVYRQNWYGVASAGGGTGEWPYAYCGGDPSSVDSCMIDIGGCTIGDIGHPLKYWVTAFHWAPGGRIDEGPPSNVAQTLNC